MVQHVPLLPMMLAACTGELSGLLVPLLCSQCSAVMSWKEGTTNDGPSILVPATQMQELDGVFGSCLCPGRFCPFGELTSAWKTSLSHSLCHFPFQISKQISKFHSVLGMRTEVRIQEKDRLLFFFFPNSYTYPINSAMSPKKACLILRTSGNYFRFGFNFIPSFSINSHIKQLN